MEEVIFDVELVEYEMGTPSDGSCVCGGGGCSCFDGAGD